MKHLKSVILLLILIPFSCKKDIGNKAIDYSVHPEFIQYVSAYTSGLISKESEVQIVFQNEILQDSAALEKVVSNLFRFSPQLEGEIELKDKNTLSFTPQEPMKQGEVYEAKLDMTKLYQNLPEHLQSFNFQFQVMKQEFKVKSKGIKTENGNDPDIFSFLFEVQTADRADSDKVEEMLTATYGGEKMQVIWSHSEDKRNHNLRIPKIPAADESQELKLQWDGKPIGVKRKEDLTFEVPSSEEFKVFQVQTESKNDQYVSLNFTRPVNTSGFYNGLFSIKKEGSSKEYVKNWVVDGNEVRVYTNQKIGGDCTFTIFPGLASVYGDKLNSEFSAEVSFKKLFPKVEFVGSGNVIPDSDGKVFVPFRAEGLNAVNVEITKVFQNNMHSFFKYNQYGESENLQILGNKVFRKALNLSALANFDSDESGIYQLELSKLIDTEPGALYNVELNFQKSYSSFSCDGSENSNDFLVPVLEQPDPYLTNTEQNNYYYDYYPDDYDWREEDNPCHVSYYLPNRNASRNILASNIGMIVKGSDNRTINVALSNLLDTKPITGAKLMVYDLQNQLVGKGVSDSQGFAEIKPDRKPFLIVAESNNQKSYLRVDDGSSLSLSNFDVDGKSLDNGLSGFLYADRGVWRPGDDIHLTLVHNPSISYVPDSQPAILELKDPQGQLMHREINHTPVNGFYTFKLSTSPEAKTGNWSAHIKLGVRDFYKNLKIETIKPNRLKIKTTFPQDILTAQSDQNLTLSSEWLTGGKSSNLKANINATAFAKETSFSSFPDYIFNDPSRDFEGFERTIFDGRLNQEGKAQVPLGLNISKDVPGMITVGYFTKVFEAGGEFSTKYERKTYSPFTTYVGINVPSQSDYWSWLGTNKNHTIDVASVDFNGKGISTNELEYTVFKLKKSWWYHSDEYNLAYYVSQRYENMVKEGVLNPSNGKASFSVNIPEDEWGNYFIRVCDKESGHCAGKRVYFDDDSWRSRADVPDESASLLTFSSNKESYEVGEKATITIPNSLKGKALLSIENGVDVLEQKWIDTNQGSTKFSFKINEQMAPNFYAHISMIQPHNATKNDLPIRMYGVIPIKVENPEIKLEPQINVAKEIEPNVEFNIGVQEKNNKPMTYTLAVVDEGLLDITNFKTPNIYEYFNQKQALGVKSWDIYNHVLGAYGGKIESVFAIGGDAALEQANKENINRFKPVVHFLGPFELKKGETANHKLSVDDYIGRVKVMVVAGQNGNFGSADKEVFVRKPLMVLSTLPRVFSPGDKVSMPVNVFAMNSSIKDVQVQVKAKGLTNFLGTTTQNVKFTEEGERLVNFDLEIPKQVGKSSVTVSVKSGKYSADQTIDLEVRSPNPPITRTTSHSLKANETWNTNYETFGIPGTNSVELSLYRIPAMKLQERLDYLIGYPHGCLEQTVSKLFPQIYLNKLVELNDKDKKQIQNFVSEGLDKIKYHQLSNGGLAYWQGARSANDWATTYATHFILEAEKQGYELPVALKNNLLDFQEREAKHWNYYSDEMNYADLEQAYRLYTLALAGKQELALMNRLKEKPKLSATSKWRLAAAYALAGQSEVALSMVSNLNEQTEEYKYEARTFGSSLRDMSMILETLILLDQKEKANSLLKRIAGKLNSSSWYSTQTTAYALLAAIKFVTNDSHSGNIQATVTINGKSQKLETSKAVYTLSLPNSASTIAVNNTSANSLFIDLTNSGTSLENNILSESNNLNLKVTYFDLDGNLLSVKSLPQGKDFKSVVSISNPGLLGSYNELALQQLFPSGWEIINTRVNDQLSTNTTYGVDYQDYRDDRVYTYFDLMPNRTLDVVVLLNATYAGNYYLPAVYCEAMYNNDVYAIKQGEQVEVVQ